MKRFCVISAVILAAAGIGIYLYMDYQEEQRMLHPKFYSSNGRLEATEIFVSARLAGRIDKLYVDEGDLVHKGDKLVQMEIDPLEATRAAIIAKIRALEGEYAMALATVKQNQTVYEWSFKEFKRQKSLLATQAISERVYDEAETAYKKAAADLEYAKASVISAEGRIAEQKAELEKVNVDIADSTLIATTDGRIQYVLAREGEVLDAGGRVLNLVDLTDAYMTFFLPTNLVGKVQMGADVRLLFDAAPDTPFPAKISFIDPVAQFTPKTVETKVERQKLMFRLKANMNPEMLLRFLSDVKTGLPGIAWVRIDPSAGWDETPIADLVREFDKSVKEYLENEAKSGKKVDIRAVERGAWKVQRPVRGISAEERAKIAATPDIKAPEIKTPAVKVEVKAPEVKTPAVRASEVKTPAVKTSEVKIPEVRLPEVKIPEAKTPVTETADKKAVDKTASPDKGVK